MRIMTEEGELHERMIGREEYYALQKHLEDRVKKADEVEAELKVAETELIETKNALKDKDKKIEVKTPRAGGPPPQLNKLRGRQPAKHRIRSPSGPFPEPL